jgi:hypothetical protein
MVVSEAANDAMFTLWGQLHAYRAKVIQQGSPMVVALRGPIKKLEEPTVKLLKAMCASITVRESRADSLVVVARCKTTNNEIFHGLREMLDKNGRQDAYDVPVKTRRQITIELK